MVTLLSNLSQPVRSKGTLTPYLVCLYGGSTLLAYDCRTKDLSLTSPRTHFTLHFRFFLIPPPSKVLGGGRDVPGPESLSTGRGHRRCDTKYVTSKHHRLTETRPLPFLYCFEYTLVNMDRLVTVVSPVLTGG